MRALENEAPYKMLNSDVLRTRDAADEIGIRAYELLREDAPKYGGCKVCDSDLMDALH